MVAFPTTRWSLIRASHQPTGDIAAAWSGLVRDYRPAILGFFRRSPLAPEAEDLAQEFLLRSMRDGWWARADPRSAVFAFPSGIAEALSFDAAPDRPRRFEVNGVATDEIATTIHRNAVSIWTSPCAWPALP